MRVVNDGSFHSFAEYAEAQNIKVKTKTQRDDTKIEEARNKFVSHHKCRACNMPMDFVGITNVMVCRNPSCKGIKQTRKDKEGNEIVSYVPSYDLLEDKWASYGASLFE